MALDHSGHLPAFVTVTDGRTADIEAARALRLPKGSIVAADRAYVDFDWINSLILREVFLVTRLKKGIKYRVLERREVDGSKGLTSDQTIEFSSARGRKRRPRPLRRIGCRDPETRKHYVFRTTSFELSAKTIADIYKARWDVELFFKWIKQNLKVKSFVGTSRNAVTTQLWIAMCMYLLVSYVKFLSRKGWRLVEILRLLQLNLFERRLSTTCSGTKPRTRRPLRPKRRSSSRGVNGTAMRLPLLPFATADSASRSSGSSFNTCRFSILALLGEPETAHHLNLSNQC